MMDSGTMLYVGQWDTYMMDGGTLICWTVGHLYVGQWDTVI